MSNGIVGFRTAIGETVFSKSESSQSPSLRGQLQLEAVAVTAAFAEASRTIIYDSVWRHQR